jgi:superfamily II DNA or RNA helicase
MFGIFNPKRNADLLLLSEALAETRSELNKVRNEFDALQIAHEELKENFLELEIPDELDEDYLIEKMCYVVRDEAWDNCKRPAEQMLEDALNEYTSTEDMHNFLERNHITITQSRADLARLTAFTFALIEELNLSHKVTELEERSNVIVETLLNDSNDEL